MRAPLSIIIPTLNAAGELPATLAALAPGLEAGVIRELIVSDGGSDDATLSIAEEAGALIVTGPSGRGGQLSRGVDRSEGGWLLLLHADTHLTPNWPDTVLDHLREHKNSAGYFRLAFRASGAMPRMVASWANLRARRFGLPYGDQGLLIPRTLYDQVGGYPDIPLMEDVAIARALKGRLRPLSAQAWTSAERYIAQGWFRRGGRNLMTLTRYLAGADPAKLAKSYRK